MHTQTRYRGDRRAAYPAPLTGISGLRARLRTMRIRFIDRRAPRTRPPLTVSRRRIYILPTRSGALFGALLVVMLLGATNYQNSLAFALTFWLTATALVSMHHAHANLLGVRVVHASARPVFVGQAMYFEITIDHARSRACSALLISADEPDGTSARIDLAAGESHTIRLACRADRRGRRRCPRLRIESLYPLGLFRVWSWLRPDASALVYPRSAGDDRLPHGDSGEQLAGAIAARGADDFLGHRPYRRGDSPRHIDWKASARTDDLRLREYAAPASPTLWFDEARAGPGDREARLSQLTCWVIAADRAGLAYGLWLAGERIEPGSGPRQRRACLRALALA